MWLLYQSRLRILKKKFPLEEKVGNFVIQSWTKYINNYLIYLPFIRANLVLVEFIFSLTLLFRLTEGGGGRSIRPRLLVLSKSVLMKRDFRKFIVETREDVVTVEFRKICRNANLGFQDERDKWKIPSRSRKLFCSARLCAWPGLGQPLL